MSKYDALGAWLRRWGGRNRAESIELGFAEIERIIHSLLPNSAADSGWWSNEEGRGRGFVQCRAWLDAGFEAWPITGTERIRFCRRQEVDANGERVQLPVVRPRI